MMKPGIIDPSLRVCVCTSYSAASEPRAPRHARAIAELDPTIEVVFIDCLPFNAEREKYDPFAGIENILRVTHHYPHRRARPLRLLFDKTAKFAGRLVFRWFGILSSIALDTRMRGFEALLRRYPANVYMGHNIETLLPICRVARLRHASTIFDAMEFYSDMGDSQTSLDRNLVRRIEQRYLPQCALVFAASDQIADELVKMYGVKRPIALYNVPPVETRLPARENDGFQLYWRNSVIGLGQRGLEEALLALQQLPNDITLHLQGRLPADGGERLRERINELCLMSRVFFHAPYAPADAVKEAARHTVGLCLERAGVRNHDVTVSNKIFDYHMAGLAVVASDLPGLRGVIERSRGGLLFEPGSADDLAKKIFTLHEDRGLLKTYAHNARQFALREGNREHEMVKLVRAFLAICDR